MVDTTVNADAQAAEGAQPLTGTMTPPPAGGAQTAQAASVADGSGSDDDVLSLDEARKLRRENAGLRKRVADYEVAQANAEASEMSELQKARAKIAELERQAGESRVREQERSLRLTVDATARKLGFWDPEVALGLIDRDAVEYDDAGTPKNIERLLTDIAKDKPRLIHEPDFGGGPRGVPPDASPSMNDLLKAAHRGG